MEKCNGLITFNFYKKMLHDMIGVEFLGESLFIDVMFESLFIIANFRMKISKEFVYFVFRVSS